MQQLRINGPQSYTFRTIRFKSERVFLGEGAMGGKGREELIEMILETIDHNR